MLNIVVCCGQGTVANHLYLAISVYKKKQEFTNICEISEIIQTQAELKRFYLLSSAIKEVPVVDAPVKDRLKCCECLYIEWPKSIIQ